MRNRYINSAFRSSCPVKATRWWRGSFRSQPGPGRTTTNRMARGSDCGPVQTRCRPSLRRSATRPGTPAPLALRNESWARVVQRGAVTPHHRTGPRLPRALRSHHATVAPLVQPGTRDGRPGEPLLTTAGPRQPPTEAARAVRLAARIRPPSPPRLAFPLRPSPVQAGAGARVEAAPDCRGGESMRVTGPTGIYRPQTTAWCDPRCLPGTGRAPCGRVLGLGTLADVKWSSQPRGAGHPESFLRRSGCRASPPGHHPWLQRRHAHTGASGRHRADLPAAATRTGDRTTSAGAGGLLRRSDATSPGARRHAAAWLPAAGSLVGHTV